MNTPEVKWPAKAILSALAVLAGVSVTGAAACDGGSNDVLAGAGPDGSSPSSRADGGGDGAANPGPGTGPGEGNLSADRVSTMPLPLGAGLIANEDEAGLSPVIVSAAPDGTSRVAWRSAGVVHVTTVDGADAGKDVQIAANDLADLLATPTGGVVLITRDATGGGVRNCGNPANLCGSPPDPPIPCFDQYIVGFDAGGERWATKLTTSSASLPPYSTSRTGPTVFMTWWYAHHGRLATDGTNFAAYFADAVSVSEGGCINIHQADRMKVVSATGALDGASGFDLGCSHSGYERIVWDPRSSRFVTVCKTDNANRIAFSPTYATIKNVDLAYSNFGDFVVDPTAGGYWGIVSDARSGQPGGANGLAEVHLLHFAAGVADTDLVVTTGAGQNERAPHIARLGGDKLLVAWEESTAPGELAAGDPARRLWIQARRASDGTAIGAPLSVSGRGNRYQSLTAYPNGDVGMVVIGEGSRPELKRIRGF